MRSEIILYQILQKISRKSKVIDRNKRKNVLNCIIDWKI